MMKYTAKDLDGQQYGPVSEEELMALVEQDKITEECPVKKALMPTWVPAKELSFLKPIFQAKAEQRATLNGTDEPVNTKKEKTSFENRFTPVHAGLFVRIQAALYDAVALLLLFAVLASAGTAYVCWLLPSSDTENPVVEKRRNARAKEEERYLAQLDAAKKKAEAAKKAAEAVKPEDAKKETKQADATKEIDVLPKRKPDKEYIPFKEEKRAPTVTDDMAEGFRAGSRWLDQKTGISYVCVRATNLKAGWVEVSKITLPAYVVILLFLVIGLLWLILPLIFRAQTLGMRYFGIFLCDAEDYRTEVLELRAFSFWLLSILTCVLAPFALLLRKPTIAEKATGVRVTFVAAKK